MNDAPKEGLAARTGSARHFISIKQSIIRKSHIVCVEATYDDDKDYPGQPFLIEVSLGIPDTDLSLQVFGYKTMEERDRAMLVIAQQLEKE